jgi:16S rRNA (cytidine1402-2'-O)-methyltransferase
MAKRNIGALYLIPNLLGDSEPHEVLPLRVKKSIDVIDDYIVENEKSARAFIKRVLPKKSQPKLNIFVLNKYTDPSEYSRFLEPCRKGIPVGLISEAGVPCIADPGSAIVEIAHRENIPVVPLVGPSSILLALMASGMNGQQFAFNGYLPIDTPARKKAIRKLEGLARRGTTQIFMETPYRNMKMLEDLLVAADDNTRLCIAADISLPSEFIQTKTIKQWRRGVPDLHKRPSIFILG